jgi:broad-specificity NMP kinase
MAEAAEKAAAESVEEVVAAVVEVETTVEEVEAAVEEAKEQAECLYVHRWKWHSKRVRWMRVDCS